MATVTPFDRQTSADQGNNKNNKRGSKTFTIIVGIILFLLLGATLLGSLNQNSAASAGETYVCYEIRTHSMYMNSTEDCGTDRLLTLQDLVGPVGDPGEVGALGAVGPSGKNGTKGKTGATGPAGAQGLQGETGLTGPQGIPGTDGLPGIQGLQGIQGETGSQGIQGEQGVQGVQGEVGETGSQGIQGEQGVQGEVGETGSQGIQGVQGIQGIKGDTGADGTSVTILGSFATTEDLNAAHPTGTAGDSYLINGDLYVWNPTDETWVNVGHIQGPKGDKGDTGEQGVQGLQGPAGAQGIQGIQGIQGVQGLMGFTGEQGLQGIQGEQGIQGIQGEQGPQGIAGTNGTNGVDGVSGFGSFGYFWDEITQTNPDPAVANALLYRVNGEMNGISIVDNSRITFANAGVYNIEFSIQLSKTNGSSSDIYLWLRQQNFDVPFSATAMTIQGNTQKLVAAWNFYVTVAAGDNVQIMWTSTDTSMQITAAPATAANGIHPYIPEIPSVIMTVEQVQ
ncbi:MAG: hypothetical protein RJA41_462 [Actinomycetota bacterium]